MEGPSKLNSEDLAFIIGRRKKN